MMPLSCAACIAQANVSTSRAASIGGSGLPASFFSSEPPGQNSSEKNGRLELYVNGVQPGNVELTDDRQMGNAIVQLDLI
jgi:hypothetical protein